MGLVDKLTEADKYIWKQHEKVTSYCNKEYGWNKYDLVRKANIAMFGSLLGGGTYMSLMGGGDNLGVTVLGGTLSLLAVGTYPTSKKIINIEEAVDTELLIYYGATREPRFGAYRPASLVASLLLTASFATAFFTGQLHIITEKSPISQEEFNQLGGLAAIATFCGYIFWGMKSYFQDQIMTPPKKKKSVLKSLSEKATEKIQPAPVPQLEPVKPTKYQSIDNIVEGA